MSKEARILLMAVVIKNVIARSVQLLPFLGVPVISTIFSYFVSKILNLTFDELEVFFNDSHIEATINGQVGDYQKALSDLRKINNNTTKEEKDAIKKRVIDAANNLIRFDIK